MAASEAKGNLPRKIGWKTRASCLGGNFASSRPTKDEPTRPEAFPGDVPDDLRDGVSLGLHDGIHGRPTVCLPVAAPVAVQRDLSCRLPTGLSGGIPDPVADMLSGGVLDDLFGGIPDDAFVAAPGDLSDEFSDRLSGSVGSVTDGPTCGLSRVSSTTVKPHRKIKFLLPDKPAEPSIPPPPDREHRKRKRCKKALSKARKAFKSAFELDEVHLELFVTAA